MTNYLCRRCLHAARVGAKGELSVGDNILYKPKRNRTCRAYSTAGELCKNNSVLPPNQWIF